MSQLTKVMKTSMSILFAVMVIAQIFVPSKVILDQENILKNGTAYRFKLEPIDPNDPFRGKYIILNFEEDKFPNSTMTDIEYNEPLFVEIANNADNFMTIKNVSKKQPSDGVDFVNAKSSYRWGRKRNHLKLDYPFDKFYMEETKAPLTEAKFREMRRDSNTVAWAVVKVLDGGAVVEDVLINGESVRSILE